MSPPKFPEKQTPRSSESTTSSVSVVVDGSTLPRILTVHGQNQFYRTIFATAGISYPDTSRLGMYKIPKKCSALPGPVLTEFLWKQKPSSNHDEDKADDDNKDHVLKSILTPHKIERVDNSYNDAPQQFNWSHENSFTRVIIKEEVASNVGCQSVFSFSHGSDVNLGAPVKRELLSNHSGSPSLSLVIRSPLTSPDGGTSQTAARSRYKFKSEKTEVVTISDDEEEQDDHKCNRGYGDYTSHIF